MKKYLFFILLIGIFNGLLAQDVIVFRTGDEKEVIVKKVGVTIIEYVRYNNQQGAVYEVLKEEVFMIKYENGVKDVFEAKAIIDEPTNQTEGMFIDERDGEKYKWIKIGEQVWMKDNLRYNDGVSPCIKDKNENCTECGRYYSYDSALISCPLGWHLPTDKEWMKIEIEAGMMEGEAAKYNWRGSGKGQAPELILGGSTGLDLLMCGSTQKTDLSNKSPDKTLPDMYLHGYYWTATKSNRQAMIKSPVYRHFKGRLSIEKNSGFKSQLSVRCVKDTE